jgi:hypothetical protein
MKCSIIMNKNKTMNMKAGYPAGDLEILTVGLVSFIGRDSSGEQPGCLVNPV